MIWGRRQGPSAPRAGSTGGDLVVDSLGKSYGDQPVLRDVDFTVPAGEFHALLGPSGSGKTTLLRVIAGFTPADGGHVRVAGRDITHVPAEHRNTGVVFQDYALFPHMTVGQNVAFGLRMRRRTREETRARVADTLRMVGLTGYERRRPGELSGGQQQRVAVARALVIEPDLLLLDEPLSALDRKIRQSVREELKAIQAQTKVTTIIVTHDQEEALFLADRVLVLDSGRIRQAGSPTEVYRHPQDSFVAGFVGELNRISGTLEAVAPHPVITWEGCSLQLSADAAAGLTRHDTVEVQVRPEDVLVAPRDPSAHRHGLPATVLDIEFSGPVVTLHLDVCGRRLRALRLSPTVVDDPHLRVGSEVEVSLNERGLRLVAADRQDTA